MVCWNFEIDFGGDISSIKREKHKEKKVDRGDDFSKNVSPTNSCAVCGTYMTESDAININRRAIALRAVLRGLIRC